MAQRVCHAACPVHGSWCEEPPPPHPEHWSKTTCKCKWDDYGTVIPDPSRSTVDIGLPDLEEVKDDH